MKNIIINIALLSISTTIVSIAGGNTDKVYRGDRLDTNNYKNYSRECREIFNSGVIEIKNKNLDYDKNHIYFKHQRITYVIPDKCSKKIKNCIRERATGINEVNMKKLLKTLD